MRFGPYTNYDGALLTNFQIIVQPVGDPAIDAAGNASALNGLPKRLTIGADGMLTNLLQNQNYRVLGAPPTPLFFTANGYVFRAPLDSGPTIYSTTAPGVFITGMNYFVTLIMSNGVGSVTYNAVTNALGYAPLQPADTNAYIRLLQATNVVTPAVFNASNSIYSDYTTRIAVLTALSITNAFATNAAGVQLLNNRLYLSTNYDAPGAALAIGLASTNFTLAVSNALSSQIGSAGISAVTATNIATNQVFLGTNGLIRLLDATNVFNAKISAPSNTLAGLSITNAYATNSGPLLYTGQRLYVPTNFDANGAAAIKANTNTPTIWNPSFVGLSDFRHGSVTNIQKLSSDNLGTGGASGNESIAFGFDSEAHGNYSIAVGDDAITGDENASAFGNSVEASGYASHAAGESVQILAGARDAIGLGFNVIIASSNCFVWGGDLDNIASDNGISSFTARGTNGFYFLGSPMHGNALGLTNLPIAGISTNGSKALQIPVSIGGIAVWTNAATALGSTLGTSNIAAVVFTNQLPALTNSFVTPPNLQASYGSGTNTWTGFLNAATNIGIFTVGASQFFETLQGGNFTFQLTPKSPGATFKVNGAILGGSTITGNAFFGDGWGLTNTTSTNLALGALVQVTNIAASLSSSGINASTATNISAAQIGVSNAVLFSTKMDKTNGFSTGQSASNFATLGNVSFGRDGLATNIISGTNFVCFLTAGSAQATNGAFVWSAGLGVYTNWLNGAILTNNSSAWLLQTNGVTLYSLSGTSPIGTYSAISGALPAPLGVYTAAINDHMVLLGYFSVTNLQQQFTNVLGVASNAIANLNGIGNNTSLTNPILTFVNAPFGTANTIGGGLAYDAILSGRTNAITSGTDSVIAGGQKNIISGGSSDNAIGGGLSNSIAAGASFIGGGQGNSIALNYNNSVIGGGFFNLMAGSSGNNSCAIVGGEYNKILPLDAFGVGASFIFGGRSNLVQKAFDFVGGRNVAVTNDAVFAWSDGHPLTSTTNSQVVLYATNGYSFQGGAAAFSGGVTSGGTPLIAQASAIPFTNSSALGITSTNLGDAANTNLALADINGNLFDGFFGSGLSYNAATRTLSASGSGSQTPVLAPINYAGFGFTNAGAAQFTNSVSVGGQMGVSALIVTNGVTNLSTLKVVGNQTNAGTFSVTGNQTNFSGTYLEALTANTLVMLDANKKLTSIANAAGVFTNDASGNFGYAALIDGSALGASAHVKTGPTTNLISSEDATGYTNTVSYLHEGVTTNITVAFNGTIQSFTVTNGPDVFLGYAGANGSCSYRFTTNVTLHFSYQPTWLAGSNNTITNGILNFSSWGGTNAAQIGAARLEKQ